MGEAAAPPAVFGLLAEFADGDTLLAAVRRTRAEGYEKVEAYTPYPMHEVSAAVSPRRNRLPYLILAGGVLGALAGFGMQYYASVVAYPMNVGGRPLNSWPSFIIITFEMTILFAGLAAVLGMLALNGLPRPHHPVFSVPEFEQASRDRFFLLVAHFDPQFDREETRAFLEKQDPLAVHEVPNA